MPLLISTAQGLTGALPSRLLLCVSLFISNHLAHAPAPHDISVELCSALRQRLAEARGEDLVDSLSAMAAAVSTPRGLSSLAACGDAACQCFSMCAEHAQSTNEATRLASLTALSNALSSLASCHQKGGTVPEGMSDGRGGSLGRASSSIAKFLLVLCRSPVHEQMIAALSTLEGMCGHEWGAKAALNQEGMLQFLLERGSGGRGKMGIEAKWRVVEALSRRACLNDLIGVEASARVLAYANEGAYGVKGGTSRKDAIPIVGTKQV